MSCLQISDFGLKKIVFPLFCLFSIVANAQNEQLALQYYDEGAFEKALTLFEENSKKNPTNAYFFQKTIECLQQLQQYEKAEIAIQKRKDKYQLPELFIELGYNYQLQKNSDKAEKNYELALKEVAKEANYAFQLAHNFEQKGLLDWAIKTYEVAQKKNPNLNFDLQTGLLQGQMGNLEGMLNKLLDYGFKTPESTATVQNQLSRFLLDDADGSFAATIRKNIILRTQKSQDPYWNQFLSWFFVQQKEYGKAFIQEKALFKRNPEQLYNIFILGKLANDEKQQEDAKTIFQFVLENTTDPQIQLEAHHFLMTSKINEATSTEYATIYTELNTILEKYKNTTFVLQMLVLTSNFEAFYLDKKTEAKARLNYYLDQSNLNNKDKALVKMALADIMVLDEKFNQAILLYAQVEENLKNDVLAYEASLKLAKTNFYKKDFDWTLQQVKALKQSPSLLIANDAVELFLLIQDHSAEDSLRVGLQEFARADLLLYQKKNDAALKQFLTILETQKGKSIEEATLFKVAKLYEQKKDFQKAITYYQLLIENHKEGFYMDEALFFSAEIYRNHLQNLEKAKLYYEKMVVEHADSLYFSESRKQFRILRGDSSS